MLNTSDSWMLVNGVYRINKGPARIFEVNWRYVICTGREQKVQMKKKGLSMNWDRYGWNEI